MDFLVTRFNQAQWNQLITTIAADAIMTGALVSEDFTEYFVQTLRAQTLDLIPSLDKKFPPILQLW